MYPNDNLMFAEDAYIGIQGEGRFVGLPMLFVRLQGCNVGCAWCDSRYTWKPFNQNKVPEGIVNKTIGEVTLDQFAEILSNNPAKHIWITGGEPTLQASALGNFLEALKPLLQARNKRIHMCTAGWIWNEKLMKNIDHCTIDVKPPSSETQSKESFLDKIYFNNQENAHEFKMVVDNTLDDKKFAMDMIEKYPKIEWTLQPKYVDEITLMNAQKRGSYLPVNTTYWKLEEFAEWMALFAGNDYIRLGLQLHKHLSPNKQRGI